MFDLSLALNTPSPVFLNLSPLPFVAWRTGSVLVLVVYRWLVCTPCLVILGGHGYTYQNKVDAPHPSSFSLKLELLEEEKNMEEKKERGGRTVVCGFWVQTGEAGGPLYSVRPFR